MNNLQSEKAKKALDFAIKAKHALIGEIAGSQGKARLHAPTFADLCFMIKELETDLALEAPASAPKPKSKKVSKKKED
jgi:hypothetical protein|tara:strand:- start:507 stop:740 length:234 start_codon:yes stop_codon:yes gene_type:complete